MASENEEPVLLKLIDFRENGLFVWNTSDMGEAFQWNFTKTTLEDIAMDANFAWLIFSLLVAMIWFTYVTHYSSRVFGQILTKIFNRFVGGGYIRIGSLTWDALAGKIMFRDIVYATEDFSLRIQDGWLVFRWWRSYVPRDISEDLSHSDTRLSLLLNGLELHIYNRSEMYSELERLFGLESLIIPKEESSGANSPKEAPSPGKSEESNGLGSKVLGRSWRDLIPVIKIEISCGRAVFGNRLVPTTLCLSMEEGHMVYSTKPAVSKLDHFMHVVNCRAENFKVTLAPSLKYTGLNDEPPRLMGEGFVILSSNTIDFYYYMDEPGIVPEVPLMVELANGDVVECHAPIWGLDIRCGKGTDFSYGPWADRKREQLFKFFFPQTYQPMKVTPLQQPGEIRAVQSFDIRFSTLAEATVDILFSKCKETNAVHMTIGAGSYMEITIPWTVKPDGYATKISGQLLHVDASTSLQYRSLLEAETLKFAVLMQYPIAWNASQNWTFSLTGTKATLHFIYEHRYFFQDLTNDWSSRSPCDLLHSVPYTWFLSFCLKEFELVTVANQFNWVDCSSHHQENAYAAFSGDFLEMSFNLPFTDFLPPTIDLKFRIQGEALDWNIALPEMSTSRPVLIALSTHAKTANRCVEMNESSGERSQNSSDKRWHNFVKRSDGWVQCWTVPILSLSIQYTYHPLSASGPAPQANVPTPEREELLLTPVRFPAAGGLKVPKAAKGPLVDFDATSLAPDLVSVELELGPSELYLYGSLFRSFLHLKENIFGEDQRMADMDPSAALLDMSGAKNESFNRSSDPIVDPQLNIDECVFDVRLSRPFHVNVSVTMHDIQAHLMKHCSKDDPPCPTISLEKLSFEMNKTFLETRLQVLVSPSVLYSSDLVARPMGSSHLQQGFVILSALQVRGHAMFSPAGRALDEETLEYSWIIEAILGQLTGRLTLPQLEQIIAGLEAFTHLALDDENQLSRPKSLTPCHHGMSQLACSYSAPNPGEAHCLGSVCPTAEDIKYKMTRLSVDLIDITMVETGTAIGLQMYPVRMATCNLHSRQTHSGLSILLPTINLRQFLATSRDSTMGHSFTGQFNSSSRFKSEPAVKISSSGSTWNRTNASGQSPSVEELYVEEKLRQTSTSNRVDLDLTFTSQEWLEVGMVEIGPVYVDIGSSMDHSRIDLPIMQNTFLKFHDQRTRRLWFLWASVADPEADSSSSSGGGGGGGGQHPVYHGKCGCRAGCTFFGRNANGLDFFDHDETESYAALANALRRNGDPSFGQSILHDNVWLIDLLDSSDADSAAHSRHHKSTSELSNSSTVKNMDDVFIPSVKSQSIRDEATISSVDPLSRISISSVVSLQPLTSCSGDSLARARTSSTPALLSISTESCRRIQPQMSLPSLAKRSQRSDWSERSEGETNEDIYESPTQDRSKASRSESHSEMFYSATEEAEEEEEEEANTSSDELVSLSSSLPGNINQLHPPLMPTVRAADAIPVVIHSTPSSSSSPLSRTTSNISFNSVESSTDDFSLVDLHLQSSRPVVDSPILLASYMTHLAGVECSNWSSPAPKFPTGIHSRTRPKFVLVKKGFSSFRLVDRPVCTPGAHSKTFAFSSPQRAEEKCINAWDTIEEDKNGMRSDATSVLVKIGRPINAMFCPLTLESAQRFTEALVPTLEHLHPMTFMTRVYSRCIGHVEQENPLKKQRVTELEQKEAREAVYRDVIKYHLRGSLQIPRINLCLLQAGIVEQIISLSALDNPRDLVCVSAAAICIDGLSLYFSKSIRQCRTVQLVHRPGETQLSGHHHQQQQQHSTKSKKPGNPTAPALVFVESTQIENEQLMTSGTLGKIHLQLRRLNNDASFNLPDNVTATVIPTACSRVLFHFSSNDEAAASCADANNLAAPDKSSVASEEDHYGSVMFECGLQGLELRAVKRVSNSSEKCKATLEHETAGAPAESGQESDPASATTATAAATTTPATPATPAGAATTPATPATTVTVGSLPSHSSHMSFKLKPDKGGTPTSDVAPDARAEAKSGEHSHPQQQHREGSDKDLSSCSLQIRAVWLSFAAPPRTTAAKKSDVTILDRNLLSTASPAINAWMNSGDRLMVTLQQLCRAAETRNLSVLAGLMVEALDLQQIHLPVKSKYSCLSLMSRTLQEDPSCQLNLVLHRYALMLENEWHALEARLSPSVVPPLSTLKQGVVVLSRQWKNAIYTPFMLTYSLHQTNNNNNNNNTQRPASFPPSSVQSASHNWTGAHRMKDRLQSMVIKNITETGDEEERTMLLDGTEVENSCISSEDSSLILSPTELNTSLPLLGSQPSSPPSTLSALKRKLAYPGAMGDSYELKTINSASSIDEENAADDVETPADKEESGRKIDKDEDLYNWMARQQRSGALKMDLGNKMRKVESSDQMTNNNSSNNNMQQQSNLLVDTRAIFGSLFASVGLENKRSLSEILSLSGRASVLGGIEELRVEIFESEWNQGTTSRRNKKTNGRQKSSSGGKFSVHIPPEVPAFLCERMAIEIEVKQVSDARLCYPRAAGFLGQAFWKPQRTTALNFSLSVGYLAQQVNMPLLRLLHQLSSVYVNAKATQVQLREQRPLKRGADPLRTLAVIFDSAASTPSPQVRPAPSPSILSDPFQFAPRSLRPSSLAQRLRSGARINRGFASMEDPMLVINTDSATTRLGLTPSGVNVSSSGMPSCWRTIYHLLELYASMAAASTALNKQHSILEHAPSNSAAGDVELGLPQPAEQRGRTAPLVVARNSERTRLVVFGIMKISRVRLLAMLSGLRLESEIVSLHTSLTYKEKVRTLLPSLIPTHPPAQVIPRVECSLTGHLGRAMIVLLEGVAPSQQTVVKITVGKSQALYSSLSHHSKDKNSGLLSVGAVLVDIPQHPGVLHGMMTRGSKQLSSTLQEFRVPRLASRAGRNTSTIPDEVDNSVNGAHLLNSPPKETPPMPEFRGGETSLIQPLVMQFSIVLQRLSITAALLPSLQAQYQMEQVVSAGMTGSKAKFTVDLPRHSLSFTTKLQITENLPPSASIELPQVHVGAEYLQDSAKTEEFVDGVVLCRGNYLSAEAEIGTFEHCLTTDLLNHLVFVQKVFMAEVNDVLIKVSGGDKPVPLWEESDQPNPSTIRLLLYNLIVRLKGIQITATTPTNTAVRLETGLVELQLSNRVQNVSGGSSTMGRGMTAPSARRSASSSSRPAKLFGRAKVDLNLSLGQLIRNALFEEAEPEFQQVAFFKTRINLRNAFQDELTPSEGSNDVADKEVVLITLTRPLIYLQPVAVDKAILVWLNYKNAYDYWAEQRGSWIKEPTLVPDKLPLGNITSQLGAQQLGTLFLQLTVDDMGICMPLNTAPCTFTATGRHTSEPETCSAVVVTLENSSISACSSVSLVSKGKFTGLCLRFADDFETGLDDWKPDMEDPAIMNLCVVSEGTYEVCSRTVTPPQNSSDNAKWILHIGWQMEGVDTHFDTSIGKQFSALGHTLTGLTGGEEEDNSAGAAEAENLTGPSTDDDEDDPEASEMNENGEQVELRKRRGRVERTATTLSELMDLIPRGSKRRSRLIEKEMSEQARIIQDLRSLGASSATVEQEMRRLQELEALASKDFRRVMLQRLKRQSVKASSIKDKLGLGTTNPADPAAAQPGPSSHQNLHHSQSQRLPNASHAHHQRSKSVVVPPSVVPDFHLTLNGQDLGTTGSSDDVMLRNAPKSLPVYLPPIEGSPPMSCLTTPTTDTQRSRKVSGGFKTPTGAPSASMADQDRSAGPSAGGAGDNPNTVSSKNPGELSVDLELDFKVFINSGKCVLHTRDTRNEEMLRRMKKERSFSSTILDTSSGQHQSSPVNTRKRHEVRQNASTSRLRVLANNTAQMAVDLTIFHIPGLDVKVYYESKTIHEDSTASATAAGSSPASVANNKGKMLTKKGSLFAWMTLHSIPEETIISPHILEFLEQALEPIPMPHPAESKSAAAASNDNPISGVFNFDGGANSTNASISASTGGVSSGSFPVDVVVYCHVQPSTFRFSCLPVSRVECLLRLPSLHLVFSSKRSENPTSKEEFDSKSSAPDTGGGGLSVTGCLSDFSLYIFHPYGGGKKSGGGGRREGSEQRSSDAESERKDSLSVNVEFVKFNLSRSRKVNFVDVESPKAVVRFSTLIDIGSASFKYDMRRLPEILAFPKAWYRRAIVRHLFLGDLSKNDPSDASLPPASRDLWAELQPDQSGLSKMSSWETLVVFAVNFTKLNVHMNMGNVMGNVSWLTKDFKAEGRLSIGSTGHKNMHIGIGLEGSGLDAKGGIVGGTIELSGIHTSLAIREDPGTEPDHRMAVNLKVLECRLDYMGTSVLMGRVSELSVELRDEWRVGNLVKSAKMKAARRKSLASSSPTKRPAMIFIHGDLGWDQLQLMMSKSTTADLIKMYLKLDEFFQQQFRSSRRIFSTLSATSIRRKGPASTPISGKPSKVIPESGLEAQHHRHWQSVLRRVAGLQVATLPTPLPQTGTIIGGTMELHGGHISLACFHGVNFKSKSWALFSLKDPCISFATEAQEIPGEDPKDIHVVQNLSVSLGLTSPASNTPVGIGYRAIEQQQLSPASMATVCRISRTQLFPPQFKNLQDWFLYAFANSKLDAMERFPSLERERERTNSSQSSQPYMAKTPDYNHTAEVIFEFPSLQLHLKSEHWQSGMVPLLTEEKPNVDCSFITDFEDHIFVTVDAEAFFFLHDLISSYVREKERVILASAASNLRTQSPELQKANSGGSGPGTGNATPESSPNPNCPTTPSQSMIANTDEEKKRRILEQIDWRNYECKTWHLEPTVRLLSWAGKRIEPYGVEYILNKLGFSQARTTIPKWVQRGAMDPLDKILSLVSIRTIAAQHAKESQSKR